MLCPKCSSPNADDAKFCSQCGGDLNGSDELDPVRATPTPQPLVPKKRPPVVLIVLGVIIGIILISVLGRFTSTPEASSAPEAATPESTQAPDTSWVPAGFNIYSGDQDIAWAYDSKTRCSILGDNGCIHIKIVSNRACTSDLYVEGNELDSAGNVLGMTNASLGYLSVGQVAKLELDVITSQTKKIQLAKIECM